MGSGGDSGTGLLLSDDTDYLDIKIIIMCKELLDVRYVAAYHKVVVEERVDNT